jgi:hypothetical protein
LKRLLLLLLLLLVQGDQLHQPGAVKALRCQLRRANPYYADTPAPTSQLVPQQLQVIERLQHNNNLL